MIILLGTDFRENLAMIPMDPKPSSEDNMKSLKIMVQCFILLHEGVQFQLSVDFEI